MLLSNDKLDKSNLKYDLMNDEKSYLIPDAKIEYSPPKNRKSQIFSWIVAAVLLLTAALWLMPTYNYSITTLTTKSKFDPTILPNTTKKVEEAKLVINKVIDSIALISENNQELALQYVEAIQEMLQDQTRKAILKINQIVTDKISEIESELTRFDYNINDASSGIVDYTLQQFGSLHEKISSTTNATYRTDLEDIFNTVDEKLTNAFVDLDHMYTFYGRYMGDIIQHSVTNATDRISKIVVSNRKFCECTIKEKLSFCYNISTQNEKISKQMESVVKVIGILNNTTFMLDTLEPILLTSDDEKMCSLFTESRIILNQALDDAESLLDAILKNDDCFLGSTVRKTVYRKYEPLKQVTLNSFEASIQSLAGDLKTATTSFQVVKEKHRQKVKQDITKALTELANDIRSKLKELPVPLEEYEERISFADMQTYMDTKFQNVTDIVNPMFEEKQKEIAERLKYTTEFITFQQLPFISTLSVNNYLPTDVCPLSSDYQTFIGITLNQSLDPMEENTVKQLSMSSYSFAKENNDDSDDLIQERIDDVSINESNQVEDEQNTELNKLTDLADSIILINDQEYENAAPEVFPDSSSLGIEIIDLTQDDDGNSTSSQIQESENTASEELSDSANSQDEIIDSQDENDDGANNNQIQGDKPNFKVETLDSFIADILNGDPDSTDSDQVVKYEVAA